MEDADDGSDCCCRGVCGAVWDLGGPAPKVPSQVNVSFLFPAAAIIGRRTTTNQNDGPMLLDDSVGVGLYLFNLNGLIRNGLIRNSLIRNSLIKEKVE